MRLARDDKEGLWVIEFFETEFVRVITFARDEETGARSVMDIRECRKEEALDYSSFIASCLSDYDLELGKTVIVDGDKETPVDFGKAKLLTTRVKKVLEQLLNET